jgi:hypothetical protein
MRKKAKKGACRHLAGATALTLLAIGDRIKALILDEWVAFVRK